MNKELKKDMIQTSMEYLYGLLLTNDEYLNFTDEDLLYSVYIFNAILGDKLWSENQQLSHEEREKLAEYIGKTLREVIKYSTGKDMNDIAKEILNNS